MSSHHIKLPFDFLNKIGASPFATGSCGGWTVVSDGSWLAESIADRVQICIVAFAYQVAKFLAGLHLCGGIFCMLNYCLLRAFLSFKLLSVKFYCL